MSSNSISTFAYSPEYPNDKIKYDWTWDETEVSESPAYGRITERIDDRNNRTDYDHRHILFKRYKSYNISDVEPQNGRIRSLQVTGTTASIIGTSSSFLGLTAGNVIFICDIIPNIYKIVDIVSDEEMVVVGNEYGSYDNSNGSIFYQATSEIIMTPGTLFYFSDRGNGESISDGGYDMYDTGNYLNTSSFEDIPYTHTQLSEDIEDEDAIFEDFPMDGVVVSNESFGTGSSYFTNTYPGLFVCSAYNVDVSSFYISGGAGADGDGIADDFEYSTGTWSVYAKRIFNGGDPSINHIIIVNSDGSGITHSYSDDTDDDNHRIDGIENVTQIHYLLTSLFDGVPITDENIIDIFEEYISIIDGDDINQTLTNLNESFLNLTNILPAQSSAPISFEYKRNNIPGDESEYVYKTTFQSVSAYNNYIGDVASLYGDFDLSFILPNNLFLSQGGPEDVHNNNFGGGFINNTFVNDTRDNVTKVGFMSNKFLSDFDNNSIGSYFRDNFIIHDFSYNIIGNDFADNLIITDDGGEFVFSYNSIGNGFIDNKIYYDFYSNKILNLFENNYIGIRFNNNSISDDMKGNHLIRNNSGNGNFERNVTNGIFVANQIIGYFENNVIGNFFFSNDVRTDFIYNNIGSNFTGNTINDLENNNDFINNIITSDFNSNDLTTGSGGFGGNPVLYSDITSNIIINSSFNRKVVYYSDDSIVIEDVVLSP